MSTEPAYLVADVGGTNARFALARGDHERGFELEQLRRFKNRDFESLRDAALTYLESCTGDRPRGGCVAVAGPVAPGVVRLTNSTWSFRPEELAGDLGLESLVAVNDFAAQARGAPLVAVEDRLPLAGGSPEPGAPCAVLGPGTGLGLGLLIPCESGLAVVPTEGGHAGFAPRTQEEGAVAQFIATEYDFVSWERLLSGEGLVNIHRALSHVEGVPSPVRRPEEITQEALADSSSLSKRVVDLFCGRARCFRRRRCGDERRARRGLSHGGDLAQDSAAARSECLRGAVHATWARHTLCGGDSCVADSLGSCAASRSSRVG